MDSSPAVANGVVYVGSFDDKVYALNATTGATLWTATTGSLVPSSPAVANGVVYVGSYDHKVYALDATTGATLWTASTGSSVYSSPAVANGVVYVGSADAKVYAYKPAPTTTVLIPTNNATVSGASVVLDASASAGVTSVVYQLSGGTLTNQVIATATPTIYGWIAIWDSTGVPNGTYQLQSVASYSGGGSGTSPPFAITVAN